MKKKKLVIIGGDARQTEIAEQCLRHGIRVYLIGFEKWNRHAFDIVKANGYGDVPWPDVDAILLPVSGLKEGNKVEAVFAKQNVILQEEWVKRTKSNCVVITGIHTTSLHALLTKYPRPYHKLLERDDIAIYNSIPSAEGTLLMALQETDITIHGSRTIVLGFGRTGQTIADTFSSLGAYVKVVTNASSEKARAEVMGFTTFHTNALSDIVKDGDICVNTIPALVLSKEVLTHASSRMLIIDLASAPGGTDFDYAKKRGMKALLAPGLPGRVAPVTAGRILAQVLIDLLLEKEA